jgi:hypothetical protein
MVDCLLDSNDGGVSQAHKRNMLRPAIDLDLTLVSLVLRACFSLQSEFGAFVINTAARFHNTT